MRKALVFAAVLADLTGCGPMHGINDAGFGWLTAGKLPVERRPAVFDGAADVTRSVPSEDVVPTKSALRESAEEPSKDKSEPPREKKVRTFAANVKRIPTTLVSRKLETRVPSKPPESRAAEQNAESYQLRLRSFWPEAPTTETFSREAWRPPAGHGARDSVFLPE
jgi:hypothetical protein